MLYIHNVFATEYVHSRSAYAVRSGYKGTVRSPETATSLLWQVHLEHFHPGVRPSQHLLRFRAHFLLGMAAWLATKQTPNTTHTISGRKWEKQGGSTQRQKRTVAVQVSYVQSIQQYHILTGSSYQVAKERAIGSLLLKLALFRPFLTFFLQFLLVQTTRDQGWRRRGTKRRYIQNDVPRTGPRKNDVDRRAR